MPPILRKEKMELSKLYNIAENENITVFFIPMPHCQGMVLDNENGCYIGLDSSCTTSEEKVILAHELGHCMTGGGYTLDGDSVIRVRLEKKADSWAIESLIPLKELKFAIKQGDEAVTCLADRFGVTEDFMLKAIKHYLAKTA